MSSKHKDGDTGTGMLNTLLSAVLSAVGWYQEWHICWVAKIDSNKTATCDGTYTVRPRMCSKRIKDLRAKLAADTGCDAEDINITAMIKIGR